MIFCRAEYAAAIDKAVFPGLQGGPLMHVVAAKAVAFLEAQKPEYVIYQQTVLANAVALAESLIGYGFDLVTGGTDTHLVLVDLRGRQISGKDAERLLESVNITVNKNVIPFDPKGANDPSGIRLGTPTLTSRGMQPEQMREVASLVNETLASRTDQAMLAQVKRRVDALCQAFPAY
jgi:glycine hydroxymethyltransferase